MQGLMAIVVRIGYCIKGDDDQFVEESLGLSGRKAVEHSAITSKHDNTLPMRSFLPRAQRITADIGITILILEVSSGRVVAEPVVGTLYNISEGGACIEVASPLSSGCHLFYQTLNSDDFSLLLQGIVPSGPPLSFSVAAVSVWMKSAEEERPPGFRIGVRFRDRQTQLFREFKRL